MLILYYLIKKKKKKKRHERDELAVVFVLGLCVLSNELLTVFPEIVMFQI